MALIFIDKRSESCVYANLISSNGRQNACSPLTKANAMRYDICIFWTTLSAWPLHIRRSAPTNSETSCMRECKLRVTGLCNVYNTIVRRSHWKIANILIKLYQNATMHPISTLQFVSRSSSSCVERVRNWMIKEATKNIFTHIFNNMHAAHSRRRQFDRNLLAIYPNIVRNLFFSFRKI